MSALVEGTRRQTVPEIHVARVKEGSTPTTRTDNIHSTWRLQGGGRGGGIRVAGMLIAAWELDLLRTIDKIDATSASTYSTVVSLTGDPHEGLGHFLFPYYLFNKGKIINVHALAERIVDDIDTDRLIGDPNLPQIDWHTTSITSGTRLSLPNPTTPSELHTNLVASSNPPIIGGLKPVSLFNGERVADNGLVKGSITPPSEKETTNAAKEVIVYLMADPQGLRRKKSGMEQVGAKLLRLQGYSTAADLLENYWRRKNKTLDAIGKAEACSPNVLVIRVPETEPDLSMTGGDYNAMVRAARSGYNAMMRVFRPLGLEPRGPSRIPSFGDIFSNARA